MIPLLICFALLACILAGFLVYSRSAKAAGGSGFIKRGGGRARIRMPTFSAGHPFISSLKGVTKGRNVKPKGNGLAAEANHSHGLHREFQLMPSDSQQRFGSNSTRETSMDNFGQRRRFSQSGIIGHKQLFHCCMLA